MSVITVGVTGIGIPTTQSAGQVCTNAQASEYFANLILDSLRDSEMTREELKIFCRKAGMTEVEESCMFDGWGGGIRELCERGFINYVVKEKKTFCLAPPFSPLPEDEAMLEIARRYFTHMGPSNIHDAMYYFRTTAAQIKAWLSRLPVSSVECGGKIYYYIENNRICCESITRCMFLAGFDQLLLAHEKTESLFISQDNIRGIFNLAGIVMPALMIDGEVVGKWIKKKNKLTVTMFKPAERWERDLAAEYANLLWYDISAIDFCE